MKKILTALLIGAFIFGVGTSDMNFASAKSAEKTITTQAKDKVHQKLDGDEMKKPPEPPKDSNGNPIAPPDKDKNSSDGKDRPEPPKDSNGNPIAPPDKDKNSDGKDRPEPPKDSNGNPIAPPDKDKNSSTKNNDNGNKVGHMNPLPANDDKSQR